MKQNKSLTYAPGRSLKTSNFSEPFIFQLHLFVTSCPLPQNRDKQSHFKFHMAQDIFHIHRMTEKKSVSYVVYVRLRCAKP